ncbi:MAG TPA: SAF domain-containing protein [Lacipirellulaceae bacterium]|jgi:hypothetical protein|nr:SAF domain-containing protein [Lacipirellulaceae bacterium]
MSNVMKLVLAVVLALAAAGLNAIWLSAEKHPATYVAAAVDLPAGEVITADAMTAVPVPGDADKLKASLIPFDNKATLLGLKTSRAYNRGDMFFQSDIKAPLELAEFEVLGPFKLISVGARFTQNNGKVEESQLDSSGNNITIAVNANFDERTRKLLQIVDPTRTAGKDKPVRIVAIQVVPKEEQKNSPAPADKNVVFQTISLDGITNVPRVLLAGDVIRFVIPAHSSL